MSHFIIGYSNKNRGLRKKQMESPRAPSEPVTLSGGMGDDSEDGDFRQECRKTWARVIKKVYEMDPLICPRTKPGSPLHA